MLLRQNFTLKFNKYHTQREEYSGHQHIDFQQCHLEDLL